MSKVSLKMIRDGYSDINELSIIIKNEINAELVSENWRFVNEVKIILLTFEKYFWRNGSYAGLTILITESNMHQTADLVGFAGGEGVFNFSWGANKDFTNKCVEILKKEGFRLE